MDSSLLRITYKKNIFVRNGILEEFSVFNANVKRFLVISCWKIINKEQKVWNHLRLCFLAELWLLNALGYQLLNLNNFTGS